MPVCNFRSASLARPCRGPHSFLFCSAERKALSSNASRDIQPRLAFEPTLTHIGTLRNSASLDFRCIRPYETQAHLPLEISNPQSSVSLLPSPAAPPDCSSSFFSGERTSCPHRPSRRKPWCPSQGSPWDRSHCTRPTSADWLLSCRSARGFFSACAPQVTRRGPRPLRTRNTRARYPKAFLQGWN